MSSFKDLRIVDNFYQTSAYFPMPTVLVSTVSENGMTNLGAYSLIQPYYIAGKDFYAMLLCVRNSSNTAQNILRGSKVALNFITDSRRNFKEAVRLGFPGDTTEEKMKDCFFKLEKGLAEGEMRPEVMTDAYQVMECTWVSTLDNAQDDQPGELSGYEPPYHDFNGITSKFGAHFILKVDKILMKEKQYNGIINGVKASSFPAVPVDYGYRDSKNFWYTKFRRPHAEPLAQRETNLDSVKYAANRIDPDVKFTDEACQMMVKIPRIFLTTALKGCVAYAKENGLSLITEKEMKIINDKRAKEKQR